MVDKEMVKKIAKLCRLNLTEKEILKFQKDFSQILDYVEKLKEVEIFKVKATTHCLDLKNVMRQDKVSKEKIDPLKLIKLMPQTKDNYLKTKPIL